jgi:hypothetical protein
MLFEHGYKQVKDPNVKNLSPTTLLFDRYDSSSIVSLWLTTLLNTFFIQPMAMCNGSKISHGAVACDDV